VHLAPESRALAVNSSSQSCIADVLARESSADNVNGLEVVDSALSNVCISLRIGEMFRQYLSAILVNFNLPNRLESRTLKPKIETAYASE
jgi:hypothetical protein